MAVLTLAFLLGVAAGLRTMTPLAAVSWAAHAGVIDLSASSLAFLGYAWTPHILTALALGELVTDKLTFTPSRKVPPQFGARIVSAALCGAALGVVAGSLAAGLLAGAIGAVAGTFGGAALRGRLAGAFGRDLPAALLEDATAIALSFLVVRALS